MAGLPTELAFELSGHQGPVRSVRLNSELRKFDVSSRLYSIYPSYGSMILKLYIILVCGCSNYLLGFTCTITLISCVGNGNYCLTCGSDKTVRLWNPHKGLRIKTYSGHGAEVLDADAYVIECTWLIIIVLPLPDTQHIDPCSNDTNLLHTDHCQSCCMGVNHKSKFIVARKSKVILDLLYINMSLPWYMCMYISTN